MLYRTYNEYKQTLQQLLPDWKIYFGATKADLVKNTCFVSHLSGDTVYADSVPLIASTTYQLIFLQDRQAFTNKRVIELTDDGVKYAGYDPASKCNVFTASVTLYGPGSVPDE